MVAGRAIILVPAVPVGELLNFRLHALLSCLCLLVVLLGAAEWRPASHDVSYGSSSFAAWSSVRLSHPCGSSRVRM